MNVFQAMAIAQTIRPFHPEWADIGRVRTEDGWVVSEMWCCVIVYDDGSTADLSY